MARVGFALAHLGMISEQTEALFYFVAIPLGGSSLSCSEPMRPTEAAAPSHTHSGAYSFPASLSASHR